MKKIIRSFIFMGFLIVMLLLGEKIYAKAASYNVDGYVLEYTKDQDYAKGKSNNFYNLEDFNTWGTLVIEGNLEKISDHSYNVEDGVFTLSYKVDGQKYNYTDLFWKIKEDNDNDVEDMELDSDIDLGAIIVRTKFEESDNWTIDKTLTNAFYPGSMIGESFFSGKNIQLINGCDYQITIVYRQTRKINTSIGPIPTSTWDDRWIMERYEFYAVDSKEKENSITPYDSPRKEFGQVTKTNKNSGYSGVELIDKDDPHYGWELGKFVINGYTETSQDSSGDTVYIKKPDDKVTLWFCLTQNIDRLRNNADLCIAEDKTGSDQYFQTSTMNFKRGTLIIRHIDYEGKKHSPIIYTNFLEANTRTGAYTKVELFEEGDYEVALDYKIMNKNWIDSTTDYRIFFKFSLRNGTCAVFPFDIKTGNELNDKAITPNGFRIDLAKSRYLNINVERKTLRKKGQEYIETSIINEPAKDNEEYTEEGIYIITVRNLYSGISMEKTIYVGNDPMYNTLVKYNNDLPRINGMLQDGCEIDAEGNIVTPILVDKNKTSDHTDNKENKNNASSTSRRRGYSNENKTSNENASINKTNSKVWIIIVVIFILLIVAGCFCYIVIVKKKKHLNQIQNNTKEKNIELANNVENNTNEDTL